MLINEKGQTPFDLHVHTSQVSCCAKLPAEQMVALYKEAGYGGIFITDHLNKETYARLCAAEKGNWDTPNILWEEFVYRYFAGYRAAREEGNRLGIKVFPGIELALKGGREDYLIWGADSEFLLKYPLINNLTLCELYEVTRKECLPLIQAHPLRDYLQMQPLEYLDGYEVYNGTGEDYNHNTKAYALISPLNCAKTGGSDAHTRDSACRSGMWLPANINDYKKLAAEIVKSNKNLQIIRN